MAKFPNYATHITYHVSRITCYVLRIAGASLTCVFLLTTCQFPGTVRPVVKIGLVAPFEGRYRYVGYDVIYAVRLALREANTAGGVAGYSIELAAYDDGADPAMAAEQARKLAADPAVVAAIGHFYEETTAAAASVYAETGIVLISPALTWEEGSAYRVGPAADVVASALLNRLEGVGRSRAALVTEGGPLGAILQRDHSSRMSPVVSPESADWLEVVMASGVETVFCDADPVMAGEVILVLRDAGWEGAFLGGPALAASDFAAVAGQAAEGAIFVTPYPFPADVPGGVDFIAAYQAVSNGVPPGPLALPAYEATWVLLEALEQDIAVRGEPTRAGIGAALPATERDGLLGYVAFDASQSWSDAPFYSYRIDARGIPQLLP